MDKISKLLLREINPIVKGKMDIPSFARENVLEMKEFQFLSLVSPLEFGEEQRSFEQGVIGITILEG